MKLFLTSFLFIFCIIGRVCAQDSVSQVKPVSESLIVSPQNAAEEAQFEYQEKNYRKAIEIFESEIKKEEAIGRVSPELYYNLGNAYFRMDEYPQAILYFERALLYNPSDRDTRHNIEYAMTRIEDKILTADNFFLKIWFEGTQNLLSSNAWAMLSIFVFVLFIACLFLFFFSPSLKLKKTGFYVGIIFLVIVVFSNIFALNQKYKIMNRNTAIVMSGSAPVVSSPSGASKELFILHAGTKVEINKTDGSWYEIEIANGSVGWIRKEMVEII